VKKEGLFLVVNAPKTRFVCKKFGSFKILFIEYNSLTQMFGHKERVGRGLTRVVVVVVVVGC